MFQGLLALDYHKFWKKIDQDGCDRLQSHHNDMILVDISDTNMESFRRLADKNFVIVVNPFTDRFSDCVSHYPQVLLSLADAKISFLLFLLVVMADAVDNSAEGASLILPSFPAPPSLGALSSNVEILRVDVKL